MDKSILEQYADLTREQEDLKKRIRNTERKIMQLCKEQVADSVTHGKRGKKPLKRTVIVGTPARELRRKRSALERYKAELEAAEYQLQEMISDVQRYISQIDDSRIRRIFQYRYVDKLTWFQVAMKMGKHHTAESCRMAAERYLGRRK